MKKYLQVAVIMAILGLCAPINAEQSGGFLGAGLGYGNLEVPFDYSVSAMNQKISGEFSGGGVAFGFIGGYKQFFHPYFGLRYYANVNFLIAKVSQKNVQQTGGIILDAGDNRSTTLINYGLNIDMLINFIVSESSWNRVADFGAFVGVGVGGNSWSGESIQDIDDYVVKRERALNQNLGWKTTRNFFDASLNVGLRTNILTHHGIELAFRVPLYKNAFLDKQKEIGTATATFNVHTRTPRYAISLRYVYAFEPPKSAVREVKKINADSAKDDFMQKIETQDLTDSTDLAANKSADSVDLDANADSNANADLIDSTANQSMPESTSTLESTLQIAPESIPEPKPAQEAQPKAEPQSPHIDSSKKSDEVVNPCGNYKCIYKVNPR